MAVKRPPPGGDDLFTAAGEGDAFDREDLNRCRRCDLWKHATQGVPGEGSHKARILLVGEQPGDEEDVAGRPFVGPAGRLLRELIERAGIDPELVFITNAVKHFSFEPRGKRRIHKTPTQREVAACQYWLQQEITRIKPKVIVTLGATALGAIVGKRMSITDARGAGLRHISGVQVVATYHPSAALRAPDDEERARIADAIVDDLVRAAKLAAAKGA
jgi:DNA polymerase